MLLSLIILGLLLSTSLMTPAEAVQDSPANPCNPCSADNPCSTAKPADNPCGEANPCAAEDADAADAADAPAGPVYDSTMPLNEQYSQMRLAFIASLPEEQQEFFANQQQLLSAKDIPALAVQVGEQAPNLMMAQPGTEPLAFADFVADGPVILQFYRGNW